MCVENYIKYLNCLEHLGLNLQKDRSVMVLSNAVSIYARYRRLFKTFGDSHIKELTANIVLKE